MSSLEDILIDISKEIRIKFNKASKKSKTSDDIGVNLENIVKDFLREFLPLSHSLHKWEIIDSDGNRSTSADIVICSPFHPFTTSQEERGMFFAEGILCEMEIKSDLGDKRELERGLKQIQSMKKLNRKRMGGDMFFGNEYDIVKMKKISTVLFGFKGPSLETLKKNIEEFYSREKILIEEQVDLVVLFDTGLIFNIKHETDNLWITKNNERQLGIVATKWDEKTLFGFLGNLQWLFPKEMYKASIISLYIGGTSKETSMKVQVL